jgi:hypothetical protein
VPKAAVPPLSRTGADYVGHAIVQYVDFRWAALAALVLILIVIIKRKRAKQEPVLADALNVAIGVISLWSALMIGAIFLLTNPLDVTPLAVDTARMIGLIAVIVLVASGWAATGSALK